MSNSEKLIEKYVFTKYDEFWLTNIEFKGIATSFEIYKETLNEDLIKRIITDLDSRILLLSEEGCRLLGVLSESFWGHSRNKAFIFKRYFSKFTKLMIYL